MLGCASVWSVGTRLRFFCYSSHMSQPQVDSTSFPYSQVTENIRVSVQPSFLADSSTPELQVYSFSYTITIENLGLRRVQLLERQWTVYSGSRVIAEIVGAGVVGLQPIIEPGHSFQYTSGVVIQDAQGFMEGSYLFSSGEGESIKVAIPRFDLVYPLFVH
jgi:ApaG protein